MQKRFSWLVKLLREVSFALREYYNCEFDDKPVKSSFQFSQNQTLTLQIIFAKLKFSPVLFEKILTFFWLAF